MRPKSHTGPFILAAPNGARRTKADHPNLPISIDAIVTEACACSRAGAHGVHLHIRDADGRHSLDAGLYREAMGAIAAQTPDFPIQITTESAGLFDVRDQLNTLQLVRPDAASIAIREIATEPNLAARIYGLCHEMGTQVQHILHDPGDFAQLTAWQSAGVIPSSGASVLFVLGKYTPPRDATGADLAAFVTQKPEGIRDWMVCAFGRTERARLLDAAAHGGDLRVGFENNIHTPDGRLATSTAANIADLCAHLGRSHTATKPTS